MTKRRVQIGWLCDAIQDEGDLEDFIENNREGFGPSIDALDDYKATDVIHHSHGPKVEPRPVFIEVEF